MRGIAAALGVAMAAATCLPAPAQERGEDGEARELVERALAGHLHEREGIEHLQRFLRNRLLRPRLNVAQDARYTLAGIYLRRDEFAKAVAKLRQAIAAEPRPNEVVWVSHYNIARILRHEMKQNEKALAEYLKVEGNLRALARFEAEEMLRKEKQYARLAQTMEKRLAASKDEGERLALMIRLGKLYQKTGQGDKGIEMLERVAAEATPEKLKAMKAKAIARVKQDSARIRRLRSKNRHRDADKVEGDLWREVARLHLQGRGEEAHAMGEAMEAMEREMRKWDERREREEREREKKEGKGE